jgi:hypothetical protein
MRLEKVSNDETLLNDLGDDLDLISDNLKDDHSNV